MPYQKKEKIYSTNKTAEFMRKKRAEMVKKDPLALRSCVWVVEGTKKPPIFWACIKSVNK